MKNLSIFSLLGVVLVSMMLVGCNKNSVQTDEVNSVQANEVNNLEVDPKVAYNDTLYNLASSCKELENTVRDAYDESSKIEDIESSVKNMISRCSDALKGIEGVGDLEGDFSFRDGVKVVVEKEIAYYTKLIDILPYIDKDELTEEENEVYEGIRAELEILDKELTVADQDLIGIQEEFAARHGFRLDGVDYSDEEDVIIEDEYDIEEEVDESDNLDENDVNID